MVSSKVCPDRRTAVLPQNKAQDRTMAHTQSETIFDNFNLTVVEKTKHLLKQSFSFLVTAKYIIGAHKLTKYLESFVFDELLESVNDKKIFVVVVMSNIARV